ncbi:hypothetical protein KFE25_011141 [Diacronema lutheri]|uniref:Uncharacterized protein n=2 Tax=Diacronema lutheri TaxID=2081491 RepID=A0A8J5XM40_DIALT|nr:hypothetical protein KFE25_011141 [Diacronema lutheri]
MPLDGSFETFQYVFGRKRAFELSAALIRQHAAAAGLPALSQQAATIIALRAADAAAAYKPWYLADDARIELVGDDDAAGLVARSVPNQARAAALAFAARELATRPASLASWLAPADERLDVVTGERRNALSTRRAACDLLLTARAELLSRDEHQLLVVDESGVTRAFCAFYEPPHAAARANGARSGAGAAPSLDTLVASRLLHAKAEVANRLPGGAAIVRRFERAAAFEDGLKARLANQADGGSMLLTTLVAPRASGAGAARALAGASADLAPDADGDEDGRVDVAERALGLCVEAVRRRADAHGLALVALASDDETRGALARLGFTHDGVVALDGSLGEAQARAEAGAGAGRTLTTASGSLEERCPVEWSWHVRAAA